MTAPQVQPAQLPPVQPVNKPSIQDMQAEIEHLKQKIRRELAKRREVIRLLTSQGLISLSDLEELNKFRARAEINKDKKEGLRKKEKENEEKKTGDCE